MSILPSPQRSKTALVLAGGGVAGAVYEVGALCAVDELLDQISVNDLDIYVGTSAGALVASCLANGFSPRTLLALLDTSVLGIEQLSPNHVYAFNLPDVLRRGARLPAALLTTLRRIFQEGPHASLLDLLETLAIGLPTGLYDTAMLEQYLRNLFTQSGHSNDFRNLPRELAIIATDLNSGQRAIFGHPPLDNVPISLAVCASAAVPLFYQPVRAGSSDYLDGGIRGTVSLDVAIDRGAELIICINPMVPFDNSRHTIGASLGEQGLSHIGNQVFRTFVHAGLHYHLKQVQRRHPNVDIVLIEPRHDDPLMFAENAMRYHTRMTIVRHGFETVAEHLTEQYEHYRTLLARHGVRIHAGRMQQALEDLRRAGNDIQAVRTVLSPVSTIQANSTDLAHTLAELDRLLDQLERKPAA
ncbi:MAG: patatin-like phospholipase family protein [Chloroflexaceae bacterium]